jgi:hypothetical protein
MDDWPELEDASNFRELRNQQSLSDFEARLFVDRLEKKVAERAALLERLDPWKKLDPRLQDLARQWGQPVYSSLQRMCVAYWRLGLEHMDRLHLTFKLTSAGPLMPPELTWEAGRYSMYGPSWFIVKLKVDANGLPAQFEVTVKDGEVLVTEVAEDSLKAALIQAFNFGPYNPSDRQTLPEPGIPLDLKSGLAALTPDNS